MRKPFEGLQNVIMFNWHYYVLALFSSLGLFIFSNLSSNFNLLFTIITGMIILGSGLSLLISYYIFDKSGLYNFEFLESLEINKNSTIINITAGFDETSLILKSKFEIDDLKVFDFYNPMQHTEVSIRRARKIYKPFPNTKLISSTNIPINFNSLDFIFVIFSAHEIRNNNERRVFLSELKRILKPNGKIIIIEHLRDTFNFLAFNFGAFHFYSRKTWYDNFKESGLEIFKEIKPNPFITTFILVKNEHSS